MARALIDLTDDELKEAIRREAENVQYSYNGLVAELSRRTTRRHGTVAIVASCISAAVAVIAVILAAASFAMR